MWQSTDNQPPDMSLAEQIVAHNKSVMDYYAEARKQIIERAALFEPSTPLMKDTKIEMPKGYKPGMIINVNVVTGLDGSKDKVKVTCPPDSEPGTMIMFQVAWKLRPIVHETIESMISCSKENILKMGTGYDYDDFCGAFDDYMGGVGEDDLLSMKERNFIQNWVTKVLKKWIDDEGISMQPMTSEAFKKYMDDDDKSFGGSDGNDGDEEEE